NSAHRRHAVRILAKPHKLAALDRVCDGAATGVTLDCADVLLPIVNHLNRAHRSGDLRYFDRESLKPAYDPTHDFVSLPILFLPKHWAVFFWNRFDLGNDR